MLFGLIAGHGMRVSEALDLRFDDVLADGVLPIRDTKFGKSRLVPCIRPCGGSRPLSRQAPPCRGIGRSPVPLGEGKRLASSTVSYTFRWSCGFAILLRTAPPAAHS